MVHILNGVLCYVFVSLSYQTTYILLCFVILFHVNTCMVFVFVFHHITTCHSTMQRVYIYIHGLKCIYIYISIHIHTARDKHNIKDVAYKTWDLI